MHKLETVDRKKCNGGTAVSCLPEVAYMAE